MLLTRSPRLESGWIEDVIESCWHGVASCSCDVAVAYSYFGQANSGQTVWDDQGWQEDLYSSSTRLIHQAVRGREGVYESVDCKVDKARWVPRVQYLATNCTEELASGGTAPSL